MVNPWKMYVKLSAVLMGSHGLTKGSLAFLNYPAQLMFKSTKVFLDPLALDQHMVALTMVVLFKPAYIAHSLACHLRSQLAFIY